MELFIFVRFHAKPGVEAEVEQALQDVVPPTREEAGCLSIHAFRSIQDPRLFYIHSHWKDQSAFVTHASLPHTVRFFQRVESLIEHEVQAHRCELIA